MQDHHMYKPASRQASLHVGQLILVTGPRGAGKTRACQELAERGRAHTPCGLISQPLYANKEKIGITLVDLGSGQRRLLATPSGHVRTDTRSPRTGHWAFFPSTLDWGNQVLQAITDCRLLLVDELGPLEWEQQQGLIAAQPLITARRYACAFVVVRPRLVDQALKEWPWGQVNDITHEPNLWLLAREVLDDRD